MMKSRRLMGLTPKDKDHELTITGQPVHRSKGWPLMSALGQKQAWCHHLAVSGLPPKADFTLRRRGGDRLAQKALR
jgi:hypothetical protein